MGGYITDMTGTGIAFELHRGPDVALSSFPIWVRAVFFGLSWILQPLQSFDGVSRLIENEYIPWTMVGRALIFYLGVYTGLTALFGSLFFSRREVGLVAP